MNIRKFKQNFFQRLANKHLCALKLYSIKQLVAETLIAFGDYNNVQKEKTNLALHNLLFNLPITNLHKQTKLVINKTNK